MVNQKNVEVMRWMGGSLFPEADDCGTTVANDDGSDDSWYYHDMLKNCHVSKD